MRLFYCSGKVRYTLTMKKFTIQSKIWQWHGGQGSWHFVNVGDKESKILRDNRPKVRKRGFGAVKIKATIGKTSWTTSIFPTKEGPYVLPIKASVRTKEMVQDGDKVKILCELI